MEFCVESKLTMALFAILTPYPGTQLYKRLLAEGRLTDPKWWLRKDHDALKDRLASIPAMREQEAAALRRRYADPQSRWFPAAITFLVPASIAKGAL